MTNASDVLVERLLAWGVDTIFGLPGDGINGVFEALRKQKEKIRFIHVRHEESAALMACAYAKFTSRLGVCVATSGPGGIHLLNGLYDAKMDHAPVLAITGLQHSVQMMSRRSPANSSAHTCAKCPTKKINNYRFRFRRNAISRPKSSSFGALDQQLAFRFALTNRNSGRSRFRY